MKKETLVQSIIVFVLIIILSVLIVISINRFSNNERFEPNFNEETTEKETKKEDVDSGNNVKESNIDLEKYNTNINIDKGGEYNITGSFNNSIIVDSTEKVILNLNNVNINSDITAAIANINTGELIINLVDSTTNILKDNGSSEYDGCIFSIGNLIIQGNGILKVYGNQEEGEGIATENNNITINSGNIYIESKDDGLNAGGDGGIITIDGGEIYIKASGDGIDSNKDLIINGGNVYTMGSSVGGDAGIDTDGSFKINSGTVIALGSDMLQNPDSDSQQKSICFNLKNIINKGSNVVLKNDKDEEIISFKADDSFRTLIISVSDLDLGTYHLYSDGSKISEGELL